MYSDIVATINTQLETVDGLNARLEFEPRAVPAFPLSYLMLTGVAFDYESFPVKATYTTQITVLIGYSENASAEEAGWTFANTVPAAVTVPPESKATSVESGFATIANKEYRAIRVTVESVEWLP